MDNNTSNGCGLLLLMFLAISAFAGFLTVFTVQRDATEAIVIPTPAIAVEESAVDIAPTAMATDAVIVVTVAPADAAPADASLNITVLGAGDLNTEAVELLNTGDTLDLTGWQISDEDGNRFTFPAYILYGGGIVRVMTRSGAASPIALYWNQDAAIWSAGETLTLSDAAGTVHATVVVSR
jgi:hypothetical protein